METQNNKIEFTIHETPDDELKKAMYEIQEKLYVPNNIAPDIAQNATIIALERKLGIRTYEKLGYDVTNGIFFVDEQVQQQNGHGSIENILSCSTFETFEEYYSYLDGSIYDKSCYYGYKFSKEEIKKYSINVSDLNFESLLNYTIDDFTLAPDKDEIRKSKEAEKNKKRLLQWMEKFNRCTTYKEFANIINRTHLSTIAEKNRIILICDYIIKNIERAFSVLMEYINCKGEAYLAKLLCLVYDPDLVIENFKISIYSKRTISKHRSELKKFIHDLKSGVLHIEQKSYYDDLLNLYIYCRTTSYSNADITFYQTFEKFEELVLFLNNDLSDCNLLKAEIPDFEKTKYKSNDNTVFPLKYQKNVKYKVTKIFWPYNNKFYVAQTWTTENKVMIKQYEHSFALFIDFAKFLKSDLTYANLLFCDGLKNIYDLTEFNLKWAKLRSAIERKINPDFIPLKFNDCNEFSSTATNELATITELQQTREPLPWFKEYSSNQQIYSNYQQIFYISDIHLQHRIKIAECINYGDIEFTLRCIAQNIFKNIPPKRKSILLIGGDTSSDFDIFKLFVKILRFYANNRGTSVIFTLGNHELWNFDGEPLDEIIMKYRNFLANNNMFLLQNSLIFIDNSGHLDQLFDEQLNTMAPENIYNKTKSASTIIFGGLAFAGKNMQFNAEQFIYRNVLNRQQEIIESERFEALYNKICSCLSTRKVIILSHTPKSDWSGSKELQKGFIYVNGHSHKNYFYDDGEYRIYADNQIGYYSKSLAAKFFYIDREYDIFERYHDGIYEITKEEYIEFYRGKNILMSYSYDKKLYMIKKQGYYMFILDYENGNLYILNGGAIKKLPVPSIEHYYNNIDHVIKKLYPALQEYTQYQHNIANAIKAFGGNGEIHGAIVDIDYFNHVYVNPIDMTVTPYWASSIISKIVYHSITALLKDKCPELYIAYKQMSDTLPDKQLILQTKTKITAKEFYLDTDIYKASNEIKKMQRLNSNILSTWIEIEPYDSPTINIITE